MRKLFTTLIGLCCILSVTATPISRETAKIIAATLLHNVTDYQPNGKQHSKGTADYQPFYVFNSTDGDGFVIIAGDDAMPEILAKADNGNFDSSTIPPQLEWLLQQYEQAYESLRDNPQPSRAVEREKKTPMLTKTANFGQEGPYNAYCPDGSLTGCGATAIAIMMHHLQYPSRGEGSHSYKCNGRTLSMDFDFDINWNQILDDYSGNYTKEQADAVAKLMYAIGVAIEMEYGKYESTSSVGSATVLAKYFKYYGNPYYLPKDRTSSDADWENIMDGELDRNGVLVYRGADKKDEGGHIFIVDGRDEDGRYHINWGWEGAYNGYFYLTKLTPSFMSDYSHYHGILYSVFPEQTRKFSPIMLSSLDLGMGLVVNAEKIVKGQRYNYSLSNVYNVDNERRTGQLGVLLVDKDNYVKSVLAYGDIDLLPFYYYYNYSFNSCTANADAQPSDRLVAAYRDTNSDPWQPLASEVGTQNFFSATDTKPRYAEVDWQLYGDLSLNYCSLDPQHPQKGFRLIFSFNETDLDDILVTANGKILKPSSDKLGNYEIYVVKEDKYVIKAGHPSDVNGIAAPTLDSTNMKGKSFDIFGRPVDAETLSPSSKGIFIINGKKEIR